VVSRKSVIFVAILVVGLVVAIAVLAVILDRERDQARLASAIAATSTTGVSSPYDFVELPGNTDLGRLAEASLVSILVKDATGQVTSYGVSTALAAAQALTAAFGDAEEADDATAEELLQTGEGAASESQATITFVLPNREIMTFSADLDRGLVARDDSVWRVDGDLRALVEAATSGEGQTG
jgi:hypothetical protein